MSNKNISSKNGHAFVFSAPSGAGKTSLVNELVKSNKNLHRSISHTTRDVRKGERDGVDYFFVSTKNFDKMVANDEFIEHANVFGAKYGTRRKTVNEQLLAGKDVALDIDWQGARKIRETINDCISIFILPPTMKILKKRLVGRGDLEHQIDSRMEKAINEIQHFEEYDYLVFNDNFEHTLAQLQAIVTASKLRTPRQKITHQEEIRELIEA